MKKLLLASAVAALMMGCANSTPDTSSTDPATVSSSAIQKADKFTYANYDEVQVTHLDLDLDVDFERKALRGTATLNFKRINPDADVLVLDTKDLTIFAVTTFTGEVASTSSPFLLSDADPVLGSSLTIPITPETTGVVVAYETSPTAEGLGWLSPVSYTHLTLPTKA